MANLFFPCLLANSIAIQNTLTKSKIRVENMWLDFTVQCSNLLITKLISYLEYIFLFGSYLTCYACLKTSTCIWVTKTTTQASTEFS